RADRNAGAGPAAARGAREGARRRGRQVPRPDRDGVRVVVRLRVAKPAVGSRWSGVRILVGPHRGPLAALAATSILSGLAEAAILAAIAQVAAALVSRADSVRIDVGVIHLEPTIGVLLILAGVLAVARIGLLAGVAVLLSRLTAEVQAELRKG